MNAHGRPSYPLAVIDLAGSEVEMGRQHGAFTRELGGWEATPAFYGDLPSKILGMGRRDRGRDLVVRALGPLLKAGTTRLDKRRPAAQRARSEAFFAALGRPPEERRGLLVLDVAQNAVGLLARWGFVHEASRLAAPGACSCFALWGETSEDGRLLHARNFDLPGIGVWDRAPAVAFCTPTHGLRYGFITTRGADLAAVTAFNEAGLVVSTQSRFHREVTFDGLSIVDLGHMVAARATSLADAVAIAAEQRIASSWGIVVSSARERRALVIEAHAGRIAVHRPRHGASHVAVTNRNRVPVMQQGEVAPSTAWVRYSDGREAVMERRLDGARGLDVAQAMALLSSHEAGDVPGWERMTGDCPAQSITVHSSVVDPEREEVWISTGAAPTSKGPWVRVPWRWGGGPGMRVVEASAENGVASAPLGKGREAAHAHYVEAARREAAREPEADVEAALMAALRLQPDDPSYRHLAGGLALRTGRPDEALVHFETALAHERSAFRSGELRRWASLAAQWNGQARRANDHRGALMAMVEPACRDAQNARALPRRRHREIGVDFQLLTLSV